MNQKNGRTDPGPLRERARSLFISQATIDETLEWATPRQLAAIDRMLATELANREASKRARLMRQARFPVPKSLDGYDFANVRLPNGYTKEQLTGLDFAAKAQDLVFYGKTGRGKTHLATALGMIAVERGRSVRFRQTAELVLQLGKAKRDGALDSLLKDLARADLIILDEFGYVPFDIDGARLLYQIIAGSYERRSIILRHEHRVRQMGDDLRRRQARRRDHRPHRPPRTPHRVHRPQPTRQMGYPSKEVLASWIDELAPGERRIRRGPVPGELKRDAVLKVASGELSSREAAEAVGVDSSVVRNWKRQLLGDAKGLMVAKREPERGDSSQQDDPDALRGEIATLRADLERLRAEQRAMEIRLAIMKGAAELVGKEPGADPDNLTSREKTTLIKDISETLGVNAESLLKEVGIARSTYYYQLKAMRRPDKNANLLSLVREAFGNSRRRYGYKRVHLELKSAGIIVSAKRIMRLMTSHGMVPVLKSAKRYSSYKGEIGGAPANLVNRDFHATAPNRLWVTDITEFSIPAGKVYLSPVIDCHDGMPVAWTIGTSPNAALANGMLRDACATPRPGETPIIHSD